MLKTATEIVSESWHLYANNWRKLVPYLAIIFLPTLILSLLGVVSLYLEVYMPQSSMATNLLIMLVLAASFVLNLWASIAIAKALSAHILGQQPTAWKETFTSSSHLIWPLIYTSIFMGLIVMGGFILLFVPGLIFAVWYNFYFYSLIFENKKGMSALAASKALVVGRWWPIAWRLVAPTFIFGVLNLALVMGLSTLVKLLSLSQFIEMTASSTLTSLAGVITAPLSMGAALILYYSAKQNPVASVPEANPPKA
ncbi:MAG: hypothetical protein A2534_01220 [Candidatus Magasanikbacteria bacterium RIFOXYD2_FULL_39_9]|uniref:Glycerophosphoryl diester phosphodiesterase membrane domain-containing protein n=1 Tax=Candidatus Magasanikbacteria bacterium RIFOXYD1_FULL_40_23 TaxID=1798705 RepID=A0A1F6P904_9BACT|nr:MAG: hypothetical protein A2534_01220 [Candidatus Magasanikbacteria bacterium RIFOXYD2_FULL_39_9]OGH92649.1 MAG: hypothetical protein A2563_03170 [Candidatus Magasanikbacteria bacterium RIFOXYD1_FULL_40_23]